MAKTSSQIEIEDFGTHDSNNPHVSALVSTRYSRRDLVSGGLSTFALAMFGTSCGKTEAQAQRLQDTTRPANTMNFKSIQLSPAIA